MSNRVDPPMAMLAELTHRCPLACPYCSNPTELIAKDKELSTEAWADVFRQAAALGVLQLHLSGESLPRGATWSSLSWLRVRRGYIQT